MSEKKINTPVLFLIFNRPDTTQQVFNEIRKAQPAQLFIAADGPRKDHITDLEQCKKTRDIILQIDWDCRVFTRFLDENLGCKYAVSSAIDWFFSNVDEGIILEDDCVPDQSFFQFCQELLERYREDERIMVISGNNFQFGRKRTDNSYYFSLYNHVWGWASWKRAWNYYDIHLKFWPTIQNNNWLMDILQDPTSVNYWTYCFNQAYAGKIDTWDYQWTFACWVQNGLTILPNENLVSNIGFNKYATHTQNKNKQSALPLATIRFPLKHPEFIIRDHLADQFTQKNIFFKDPFLLKLYKIMRDILLKPK